MLFFCFVLFATVVIVLCTAWVIEITIEMVASPPDLSAGPAVVPSPGQSKFTGADHTHRGSGIRNPDGSL
jgi:hypothetical protein